MLNSFLDWVYPPACNSCGMLISINERERFFCVHCEELFEAIEEPFCEICGVPSSNMGKKCASCAGKKFFFEKNFSAFTYEELIRDLLLKMKFGGKKRIAMGLGKLWAAKLCTKTLFMENSFLLPMPMHRKKQRERGFNQAEIMTIPLSKALGIPISDALIRTVDTVPQSEVHFSQRVENVQDIFSIRRGEGVFGKNFILTDDIFTTGASLNECARTLKNAGASRVSCMTFAISVKNNSKP
ncbi:MAG: ComF family protein [Defluviitaleaceae bacterium]|nr:ComF family protein [Defluviitaleaceae bacterium]